MGLCRLILILPKIALAWNPHVIQASEIEECQGLGMTTTLGEMEKSKVANEELAKKDAAMVERVQKEGVAIFDTLTTRLKQYMTTMDERGEKKLFDLKLLDTIPENASRLGVENATERLKPFLGTNTNSAPTKAAAPTPPTSTPEPVETAATAAAPPTATSTAPPKFTWAAQSNKSSDDTANGDKSKKTLLEIQQEELKSRTS